MRSQLAIRNEVSLASRLIQVYNNRHNTNDEKYKSFLSCNLVYFLDQVFTVDQFEQYWAKLSYSGNILVIHDGADIISKTPFANKNCRVQKIRCWIFKKITKVELFETKLVSTTHILLTSSKNQINAYEVRQNQKNNLVCVCSLGCIEDIYEANLDPGVVSIIRAPELGLQDMWLLLEMQIMSNYQTNLRNTIFLDVNKMCPTNTALSCHKIFNWHVLQIYLMWYVSTYSKNDYLMYSWHPILKLPLF